ncbi:NUDIX domain-containing protein [Candidatus Uhrbacteria bacterium]|nr:NUDIX domain-containing protein [Candidatus Uhrbacteria bacterium]
MSLNIVEQHELARLLEKIVREDGFIPDVAYRAFHKLVPWPAVEVLIYDDEGRFLLSHRDDDFKGWHIPGGFMRVRETYQAACDRNVRKERIAETVTNLQLMATHTWGEGEHPFGYPISLIIACQVVGEVVERDDLKWFRRIPPDIIAQQHPKFLAHFKEWFRDPQWHHATIIP